MFDATRIESKMAALERTDPDFTKRAGCLMLRDVLLPEVAREIEKRSFIWRFILGQLYEALKVVTNRVCAGSI